MKEKILRIAIGLLIFALGILALYPLRGISVAAF